MSFRLPLLLCLTLAVYGQTRLPVILVDGWYPRCSSAPYSSSRAFGDLETRLRSMGIDVQYLRPCSVPAQPGFVRASVEELGQALGKLIETTTRQSNAPEVDVIAFSMGSSTVRAYLSGKQNAPGVFQPPSKHKIRKAVFLGGQFFGVGNGESPAGSGHCDPIPDPQDDAACIGGRFLWDLSTWNQGGDDLRSIDAIAVAGSGHATHVGSTYCNGDGVVSLTSASLSFAYPAERTRIITACHVGEVCTPTVSYVDSDSHPAWLIVKSFLSGTDEWKTVGSSPDSDSAQAGSGGVLVGVHDAFDGPIDATRVALSDRALDASFEIGLGLFYAGQVPVGNHTLEARAPIQVPAVSFSPIPGTYSVVTMKPGPLISAVMPSGSSTRKPRIPAGSGIEIYGTRLTSGGGTEVTVNGQAVAATSVSDAWVSAQLPAGVTGFVTLKVITGEGSHTINMFVDDAIAAPKPEIGSSGVMNAASFASGAVAPGEFVAIKGTNLGPANAVLAAGSQKGLGGTTVTFNGIEAFLTYSSATQVNALVPYGVAGKADVMVHYNGAASESFPLAVTDSAPGIFTQGYGPGQAWAVNDDGSFNSATSKVARGGWIVFWATGQGAVTPQGQDGEIIAAPKNPSLRVKVAIDGIEAPLIYALLVYTGEIQVAARVPDGVRTGDVPLVLTIGDASSRNDVTIAVK